MLAGAYDQQPFMSNPSPWSPIVVRTEGPDCRAALAPPATCHGKGVERDSEAAVARQYDRAPVTAP